MTISITRAQGHSARPYVVAQFRGRIMRVVHATDLVEARQIQDEWTRLDYTFAQPEFIRALDNRDRP